MYKIRKGIWETSSSSANALAMISKGTHYTPKPDKPFKCIHGLYDTCCDGRSHIYLSNWMDKMAYMAKDTPEWHRMFKRETGQDFVLWTAIIADEEVKRKLKANHIVYEKFPEACTPSSLESLYREPEWGYICGYAIGHLFREQDLILVRDRELSKAIHIAKTQEAPNYHAIYSWGLSDLKSEVEADESLLAEIIFNPGFAINIGGDALGNDTQTVPAIGSAEDIHPLQRKGYSILSGYYRNGTEKLLIGLDGTRIRVFDRDSVPEYPESIDLKITDCCPYECEFCYENCTSYGRHGTMHKCLQSLPEFVELAIGGGSILTNPEYEQYFSLTDYVNATLHANDFVMTYGNTDGDFWTRDIKQEPLTKCRALGVSVTSKENAESVAWVYDIDYYSSENKSVLGNDDYFVGYYWDSSADDGVDTVIHVINGIASEDILKPLYDKELKLLILGYKTKGRGVEYANEPSLSENQMWLYNNIEEIASHFKVVAFDTLALKQLNMKRFLTQEQWDATFMGEDGMHSMYIDLVTQTYGISSTDNRRWPLTDDIRQMFRHVREVVEEDKRSGQEL